MLYNFVTVHIIHIKCVVVTVNIFPDRETETVSSPGKRTMPPSFDGRSPVTTIYELIEFGFTLPELSMPIFTIYDPHSARVKLLVVELLITSLNIVLLFSSLKNMPKGI